MEPFVSTTASARATAPPSFARLRLGGSPSAAVVPRRRLRGRGLLSPVLPFGSVSPRSSQCRVGLSGFLSSGWRCAAAPAPDPVPSEEPASASASYTAVVVTDKPESPADEKGEEVVAASSASVEAAVVAPVSSGESEEGGGLDDILSKLDIEVTPTLILTGSGAFLTIWVLSSVVSAIDSVPLLPKLLELVGTGYSIWFIARNLLFKESRDDLFAKFEDLKQRIV